MSDQRITTTSEDIARKFHEAYERLAQEFGYETRKASAVPWENVPEPNRSLMIAVAGEVFASLERELADTRLGAERQAQRAAMAEAENNRLARELADTRADLASAKASANQTLSALSLVSRERNAVEARLREATDALRIARPLIETARHLIGSDPEDWTHDDAVLWLGQIAKWDAALAAVEGTNAS